MHPPDVLTALGPHEGE